MTHPFMNLINTSTRNLIFTFLFFLASCGKQSEKTQEILDVSEEPYHRLVFENDLFQILDIKFMPGDTSLFHKHCRATLYTSLGWYGSAWQYLESDWDSSTEHWPAGGIDFDDSYLEEPTIHRVTNIGNSPSRIIAVAHKGEGLFYLPEKAGYELANSYFRAQRMAFSSTDTLLASALPNAQILIFPGENFLSRLEGASHVPLTENWLLLQADDRLVNAGTKPVEVIALEVLK